MTTLVDTASRDTAPGLSKSLAGQYGVLEVMAFA